jgi:hypothetical protein
VATVNLPPAGAAAPVGTLGRVVYFDFDSFVVKDEFRSHTVTGRVRMAF